MMKVARCVVILLVVLLAYCVYAEEDCTEVDPGSSSDVCSMLQDKLQSALLQNPTNLYKIRKAFVNPVPPIINVEYEVEWGNMTSKMCTPNTVREFTNSTTPRNTDNYTFLWTSILYFTTISPGFLQHLQLQAPYIIIKVMRYIEPLFGEVDKDYNLNAILWNGCSTRMLLSIQLFLKVDTLPCTPSERQLESSIQELTTWLQAFTDVWPQGSLKLDVDKKFFAIFHHPPARFSEGIWKVITGVILAVASILFIIIVYLLHLVKQYFIEENSKTDEDLLYGPIGAIFIWNMFVLVAELSAIITTCSTELLSFSLKITLFAMLLFYFLTRVLQCLRECTKGGLSQMLRYLREEDVIPVPKNWRKSDRKKDRSRIKKILIINFMIQWNLFLSIEFLIASVLPAALLANAYPLQVLATAALLTTGLIFYILFWAASFRILHKRILKDCLRILPPKMKGVCKCFFCFCFFLFNYVGGVLLIVTLLAILGVGILKGERNINGPFFTFLPSGVFFVLSWLMYKFNKKKKKEDSAEDSESRLEDGRNRSEQIRASNNTLERRRQSAKK